MVVKLNQLEIFCKIIELGSFSKAADALHLSQPTVTEHMKSLEEYLGLSLLDRLGREVVPTKAGQILHEYARNILELKEEAEQRLRSLQGDLKGDLTVGASTIPGEFILPRILKAFRDKFPSLHINLIISDTRAIIGGILENRVELGVVGARFESEKLEFHRFIQDELVLIVPVESPWAAFSSISLEQLKAIPFVLREEGSATRLTMEKALSTARFDCSQLKLVANLGSTTAIIQAVKSGVGGSILSRRAVQDELDRGTMKEVALKRVEMRRDFYVVLRRGKAKSPLCEAFVTFLLEQEQVS